MFISKVLQNPDTYIVSASQALRWLQLPTKLAKIHNFTAWQCNQRTRHHILPCENPSTCTFTCDRGEAHAFRICGSCPRAYPKLGDPTGSGNFYQRQEISLSPPTMNLFVWNGEEDYLKDEERATCCVKDGSLFSTLISKTRSSGTKFEHTFAEIA
uniref:Uncharacterized protein n=1 Tax=Ascaris lumbricoides TaxID=6252 RepID=A0A0M3I0X2_ASCLU